MVQTSSTSSALVALLALSTVLSDSATALPTHRSSSAITRRAHIASHHDAPLFSKRTSLGSHSVYVDASTSSQPGQEGSTGGVRNSTINLTVISKRSSTLSTFSRVVRSFFKRSSSSTSTNDSSNAEPRLIALPQHTAAPYTKGHRTSRRQHQAAAALSRRSKKSNLQKRSSIPDHPSPRIGVVVPPRPKNIKRSQKQKQALVKRQTYSDGNEQASIYAAAIAALAPPQMTAQPIALNAQQASPSASSAEIDESILSYSSPIASVVSLPPITVTMTLVPTGTNGEYVDAAAVSLPTQTLLSSSIESSLPLPYSATDETPSAPLETLAGPAPLRQKRSTLAHRKVEHQERQKRDIAKKGVKAARSKRSINPKTGSSPSPTPSSTSTKGSTPASQVEPAERPKWTEIARF
ncbi:hypothetical protein JCM16303_005204 [Sporobolomyces ruberrimus]